MRQKSKCLRRPASGAGYLSSRDIEHLASRIPDHEVAGLGAFGHLPVIYGATRSDPVVQFAGVLTVAIHLKYVNPNHGAFQVQMPARRDVISPKGARTAAARIRATTKARWMA
jgi:hypothetical protein